jgi:aspartate/methionine/tyrosine aminotransferase
VNGTPELRQAIISHVQQRTGRCYADTEITISGGAKQIIYLALAATLNRGDEVIIPAPYWVSYPDLVLANDGDPVIGPRTRWVLLNTPSNPTGAVYPLERLRALPDRRRQRRLQGLRHDRLANWLRDGPRWDHRRDEQAAGTGLNLPVVDQPGCGCGRLGG